MPSSPHTLEAHCAPVQSASPAARWTFTSDSCGYMLFLDGKPQGGAGTRGTASHTIDGRVRHWKHRRADAAEYHDTAARICRERNAKGTP
jgi:hypothetical protein